MGWIKRQKIKAEIRERSYLQWALIRALAFGERDWVVICAGLFIFSPTRDFFSIPGVTSFLIGVFFLGPVFGMALYLTNKAIYFRLKGQGALPSDMKAYYRMTWVANALWFPIFCVIGYYATDLFFQSYDSLFDKALWQSDAATAADDYAVTY